MSRSSFMINFIKEILVEQEFTQAFYSKRDNDYESFWGHIGILEKSHTLKK